MSVLFWSRLKSPCERRLSVWYQDESWQNCKPLNLVLFLFELRLVDEVVSTRLLLDGNFEAGLELGDRCAGSSLGADSVDARGMSRHVAREPIKSQQQEGTGHAASRADDEEKSQSPETCRRGRAGMQFLLQGCLSRRMDCTRMSRYLASTIGYQSTRHRLHTLEGLERISQWYGSSNNADISQTQTLTLAYVPSSHARHVKS